MPATFLFSAFKLDLALECRLQKGRKFAKEFFSYEVSSETHKRLKKNAFYNQTIQNNVQIFVGSPFSKCGKLASDVLGQRVNFRVHLAQNTNELTLPQTSYITSYA